MRLIKYIFIALLSIATLAFIIGLFLPSEYHLERSIIIQAPASSIFEEVDNLKNWQHWSPWKDRDPNARMTYEGPEAGVGSQMLWASNNPKVGEGSQEIIISTPNTFLSIRLTFKGWDGSATADWHFEEQAGGMTKVSWSHNSSIGKNVLYKYMSILMKPMLIKDYDRGLSQLKAYVEKKITQ
jgi:hypothetical protein